MDEIFMKLLFWISDMGNIRELSLYKNGYANMEAEIDGKRYSLTLREEEEKDGQL